jgi:hypothetical protein
MILTHPKDFLHTVESRIFVELFLKFLFGPSSCTVHLRKLKKSLTLHVLCGTRSVCNLSPGACHGIHFKLERICTSSVSGINISRSEIFTVKLLQFQVFCAVGSYGWVRNSNVWKDHIAFNFMIKQLKQPAWSRRLWQYYPSKLQNISPNNTPYIVIVVISILSEPNTYF